MEKFEDKVQKHYENAYPLYEVVVGDVLEQFAAEVDLDFDKMDGLTEEQTVDLMEQISTNLYNAINWVDIVNETVEMFLKKK